MIVLEIEKLVRLVSFIFQELLIPLEEDYEIENINLNQYDLKQYDSRPSKPKFFINLARSWQPRLVPFWIAASFLGTDQHISTDPCTFIKF